MVKHNLIRSLSDRKKKTEIVVEINTEDRAGHLIIYRALKETQRRPVFFPFEILSQTGLEECSPKQSEVWEFLAIAPYSSLLDKEWERV